MKTLLSTPDITISDDLDLLAKNQQMSRKSMLLLFCRAGELQIELNKNHYDLHPDELLFCMPEFLLGNFHHTPDFQCYIFVFTSDSLSEVVYSCLRSEPHWFDKLLCLKQHPIVRLSTHRLALCHSYSQLFGLYMTESAPRVKRISNLLAQAAIFEMISWVDEAWQEQNPPAQTAANDADNVNAHLTELFGQFVNLLEENHTQRHSVSWYADKMVISSKYLTYLCNVVTGRTPSFFINDIAIREIKNRLRYTNDSIKEIAIDMQFSTASSFCKYFRLHTGMSAQTYRKQS